MRGDARHIRLREDTLEAPSTPAISPGPDGDTQVDITETSVEPAKVPAESKPVVPTLDIPEKDCTSTNFKKEWLLLGRVAAGPRATEFPQIAKAFGSGTKAEQRDVLKRYLQHGGNLDAIETSFTVERSHEGEHEGTKELLTIDGMRKRGCSERLGSRHVHISGYKRVDLIKQNVTTFGRFDMGQLVDRYICLIW